MQTFNPRSMPTQPRQLPSMIISLQMQTLSWPQGDLTAIWSPAGLSRLSFGRQEPSGAEQADSRAAGPRALSAALSEYFQNGGELDFPLAHVDWTGTPEFHRKVLVRCAQIVRGEILTYGQLAAAVGSPAAARAVGQAMARNRWPLVIPCHRVVGSSGKLTGYSGAGGTTTKQWLLDLESESPFARRK